jgi:UDP-N-acetylmuramoyl-tripeptide--D-alanyl-D-alanine ligase
LGQFSDEAHARIGERVVSLGVDFLFTLGPQASIIAKGARRAGLDESRVMASMDHRDLILRLRETIQGRDWILVKGSRSMSMEKIVFGLMEEGQ